MKKRPLSITLIGWLFVATGCVSVAYHTSEFHGFNPFDWELFGICVVRLLALMGGWFLLRGAAWARWLLVAWMLFHIWISTMHALQELIMHIVIFSAIGYFLFSRKANTFLSARG